MLKVVKYIVSNIQTLRRDHTLYGTKIQIRCKIVRASDAHLVFPRRLFLEERTLRASAAINSDAEGLKIFAQKTLRLFRVSI